MFGATMMCFLLSFIVGLNVKLTDREPARGSCGHLVGPSSFQYFAGAIRQFRVILFLSLLDPKTKFLSYPSNNEDQLVGRLGKPFDIYHSRRGEGRTKGVSYSDFFVLSRKKFAARELFQAGQDLFVLHAQRKRGGVYLDWISESYLR